MKSSQGMKLSSSLKESSGGLGGLGGLGSLGTGLSGSGGGGGLGGTFTSSSSSNNKRSSPSPAIIQHNLTNHTTSASPSFNSSQQMIQGSVGNSTTNRASPKRSSSRTTPPPNLTSSSKRVTGTSTTNASNLDRNLRSGRPARKDTYESEVDEFLSHDISRLGFESNEFHVDPDSRGSIEALVNQQRDEALKGRPQSRTLNGSGTSYASHRAYSSSDLHETNSDTTEVEGYINHNHGHPMHGFSSSSSNGNGRLGGSFFPSPSPATNLENISSNMSVSSVNSTMQILELAANMNSLEYQRLIELLHHQHCFQQQAAAMFNSANQQQQQQQQQQGERNWFGSKGVAPRPNSGPPLMNYHERKGHGRSTNHENRDSMEVEDYDDAEAEEVKRHFYYNSAYGIIPPMTSSAASAHHFTAKDYASSSTSSQSNINSNRPNSNTKIKTPTLNNSNCPTPAKRSPTPDHCPQVTREQVKSTVDNKDIVKVPPLPRTFSDSSSDIVANLASQNQATSSKPSRSRRKSDDCCSVGSNNSNLSAFTARSSTK